MIEIHIYTQTQEEKKKEEEKSCIIYIEHAEDQEDLGLNTSPNPNNTRFFFLLYKVQQYKIYDEVIDNSALFYLIFLSCLSGFQNKEEDS